MLESSAQVVPFSDQPKEPTSREDMCRNPEDLVTASLKWTLILGSKQEQAEDQNQALQRKTSFNVSWHGGSGLLAEWVFLGCEAPSAEAPLSLSSGLQTVNKGQVLIFHTK